MFLDFELFATPERQLKASDLRGAGQRGIFIAYRADEAEDEQLAYLKKILAAAKIDLDTDVSALPLPAGEAVQLNLAVFPVPIAQLILFGVKPEQLCLNFQFPAYQAVSYQGVTFLQADAIGVIQEERLAGKKQKAGALWLALQQIFLASS